MFVLNEDGELVNLYGAEYEDPHNMDNTPFFPKIKQTPSAQSMIKNIIKGGGSCGHANSGIIIQKVYNKRKEKKAEPTFFKRSTKPPTNLELSTMRSRIKLKRKLRGESR